MPSNAERNRKIHQMLKDGMTQSEVAKKFHLSPTRVHLIEKQDAATRARQERRAKVLKQLQEADEMDKLWPAGDLLDALGLIVVTRKRLMDRFADKGQDQISLREFMDMCLDAPVEGLNFMMSPLLRVYGVGKKGCWNVVNGLTDVDLGNRCNQGWQKRLVKVLLKHRPAWAR